MSSVEPDRAGIASGINNAVARVAGVLAVAALGGVMVGTFAHCLRDSLAELHLDSGTVHNLESNVAKLGGLDTPTSQDSETRERVRIAIADAFVFGFRIVMLICAGLGMTSAWVAWRMIPSQAAETAGQFERVAGRSERSSGQL
jgi:hypothetical protein